MSRRAPEAAAHAAEIASGERFEFGENWRRFLATLDDERIAAAEASLRWLLGRDSLEGLRFLDVGSGSGLSSLAARRLGARVRSFDFDPESVACTGELRRRYFPGDADWIVEEGSVLDEAYVRSLGEHDVVYSWGVLHHTGDLWRALAHAAIPVAPGGTLALALYNDQRTMSRFWTRVKRIYNALPRLLRVPFAVAVMLPFEAKWALVSLLRLRPLAYLRSWTEHSSQRGMSHWHDLLDWVGGLPFEVCTPEEVVDRCVARGLVLTKIRTVGGGHSCNEYAFVRLAESRDRS